jgi:DivIVA domain-containing protein
MNLMDVTPRELRDIEIREGFRGYNRDDVDELLERAAATIEALNERMRRMSEQVSSTEGAPAASRETEDMLHRTLLLAQRAADEAVAEAQFKARQILDDAESKSRTQLAEAETSARRQVETERRRLESEVLELASRREALLADVDGLETFESEYRARLRRALEADLEALAGKANVAPSARPTIHEVDVPAESGAPNSPQLSPPSTSPQAPQSGAASTPVDAGPATAEIRGLGTWDLSTPTSESSSFTSPTPAPSEPAPRTALFPPAEQTDSEPLDDEAFFASLREAVSDQAPLGPRDEPSSSPGSTSYEDEEERSGLFRRRR